MDELINHFVKLYKIEKERAIEMIHNAMREYEVAREIMRYVDKKMSS